MVKHTFSHRLTLRLLVMLLCSAVLSVGLFFLSRAIGKELIDRIYLSPARVQARIDADIASFRAFVEEKQISSTDAAAVGQWNRAHIEVQLTVSGRSTVLNSNGYGAEITLTDSGLSVRTGVGRFEFPVNFADGTYTVSVSNHAENRFYTLLDIVTICMAALTFLILMLLYERHVTLSILKLSRQVRQVSQGDLQLCIQPPSQDEIGQLAEDVDAMRLSIIEKLRREEDA